MKKVLLFGGTGNLGKEIAKVLYHQGYELTAVVRNPSKAGNLSKTTQHCKIADVTQPAALVNITQDFDIIISTLGKSVSPNDKSKPSFRDIDYTVNSNILQDAVKQNVKKFIYVSAYQAEQYQHLEYFKVHHEFAEKLKVSGINYSIIQPPAIFSAFTDMIEMARKGKLMTIGKGDKKTNPIYEGDLAQVCVNSIHEKNTEIAAGGKHVYTRRELAEIVQRAACPEKKVKTLSPGLVKMVLPLMKLTNKNAYHKFSFFNAVMQHDTIAPQIGEKKFEDYIQEKLHQLSV